jgi:hypothetical protein
MPEFEEVPDALRLNYYVGAIVINDSFTEHEGRVFWNTLREAGLTEDDYPREFGRLLRDVKKVLRAPEAPAEFRTLARDVIITTAKWHRYRSDLVHDLPTMGWGRRSDDVVSALNKNPPRPMRDLATCAERLQTSGYRLRGLYIIAPYWLGVVGDGWDTAANLRSWTRVAMGEIADVRGTITGTEGPSPEPPGGWDEVVSQAVSAREAREARQASSVFDLDPDEGEPE